MRLRKKKNLDQRLDNCASLIISPEDAAGGIKFILNKPERTPLCVELGCGRGGFIREMAARFPENYYIGVERKSDAAITALEGAVVMLAAHERDVPTGNLRFIIDDVKNLRAYFKAGSIDSIYINFCDPWPKIRHGNRRLTSPGFIELYRELTVTEGRLLFKTDSEELFDYSVGQFRHAHLYFEWQTRDLHRSDLAAGNVMTEYERNFTARGMPIFAACVRF